MSLYIIMNKNFTLYFKWHTQTNITHCTTCAIIFSPTWAFASSTLVNFFHTHTLTHSISTHNLESFSPSFNILDMFNDSLTKSDWQLCLTFVDSRSFNFICLLLFSSCLACPIFRIFISSWSSSRRLSIYSPLQKLKGDSIGIWILKQEVRISGKLWLV